MTSSSEHQRRDFYVYVHRDNAGQIFYVGKGCGDRAWSKDRHIIWQHYVESRLNGEYTVEIVRDGLLEQEAESLEEELILEHGENLVNWLRPLPSLEIIIKDGEIGARTIADSGRKTDHQALERHNQLRDANLKLVKETRLTEANDLEHAVVVYRKALDTMREYESIQYERGLVAELIAELGSQGDPLILDRLTLCLKKLGRFAELIDEAERYFSDFPPARMTSIGQAILKRVERAKREA